MSSYPETPAGAQELDELMQRIDAGSDDFASLSDEQREQLKTELSEDWLTLYLDDYPVPTDVDDARNEYLAIESSDRYPNLPENVRNDLLLHFDEHYGEGGPDQWSGSLPD